MALGLLAALLLAGTPASAQTTGRSYVDPFPNGDRYRVVVLGDSLAEGLWEGLYRAFEDDPTLEFVKRSKPNASIGRGDDDLNAQLADLKKDNFQIAVVMIGANDGQGARKDGNWNKVGSDAWREVYGQRVDAFIKKLRAEKLAVYWVGLPVMRSPSQASDAEAMNDLFREKAFISGAKFVDTWTGFADEAGRYSAYGPDMSGQVKRLRADDGVHFTMRGSLKLAHFVEKELRRDLNAAKQERNIPLAGDPEEQAKVSGLAASVGGAAPQTAPASPVPGSVGAADGSEGAGANAAPQLQESTVGDVNVVRPTISASTLQVNQSLIAQGAGGDTEAITSDLPGNLTALATLSTVTDPTLASSKPRLPLAQRPYYKVLIKGEQLKPKSGRGDDFSWPPS